jgi:hypothetical protein
LCNAAYVFAIRHLQTRDYSNGVEKPGLKMALIQFGRLPDKSRHVYIVYYSRDGG